MTTTPQAVGAAMFRGLLIAQTTTTQRSAALEITWIEDAFGAAVAPAKPPPLAPVATWSLADHDVPTVSTTDWQLKPLHVGLL